MYVDLVLSYLKKKCVFQKLDNCIKTGKETV